MAQSCIGLSVRAWQGSTVESVLPLTTSSELLPYLPDDDKSLIFLRLAILLRSYTFSSVSAITAAAAWLPEPQL